MYAHTYMLPSTLQLIGLAKDSYATASYLFFGYLYSGLTYISLVIHYSVRNLVLTGIITLHFLLHTISVQEWDLYVERSKLISRRPVLVLQQQSRSGDQRSEADIVRSISNENNAWHGCCFHPALGIMKDRYSTACNSFSGYLQFILPTFLVILDLCSFQLPNYFYCNHFHHTHHTTAVSYLSSPHHIL